MKLTECQRHFKGGASLGVRARPGGDLLLDPGAELGVPLLAELRAPCTRRSALAGVARPEREAGEFADTQRAGAVIEGKLHAATTKYTKRAKRKTVFASLAVTP